MLKGIVRKPGEYKASSWARQNRRFGEAVCQLHWQDADHVYAFNGAALEIFNRARRNGLRCVLDQTAAPWRYNSVLLQREKVKWPEWESCPADVDVTGEMIEREEAEWEQADLIVCGSRFVVDTIREVGGPAAKCVVVPYPVPGAPAVKTAEGCRRGPRRILFMGTLQLRKGIQYVWEAAGSLDTAGFEFRAVGTSELTATAEALLRTRIEWYRRVPASNVWSHYDWADALLLPTLSEGSANVCWEALACGVPVITTPASGVEQSGVTWIAPDRDAIIEGIRRVEERRPASLRPARGSRTIGDYGTDLISAMESRESRC